MELRKINGNIPISFGEVLFIVWSIIYYLGDTTLQFVPGSLYIFSYLAVGIFAFLYVYYIRKDCRIISIGVLMSLMMNVFQLFSLIYNSNVDIQELMYVWGFMGIALLLYSGRVRAKTVGIVFYGVILLCAFAILQGISAELYMRSSQNGVSGNVIFFLLLYYVISYRERKTLSVFPSCLAFLICVWGQGRAGVLTSAILIGMLLVYDLLFVKKNKVSSFLKITLLIMISIVVLYVFFAEFFAEFLERWNRMGMQTSRYQIWKEYFMALGDSPFFNTLFGPKIKGSKYELLNRYNGNAHNSFLILHSRYGLGGVLLFSSILFYSFKKLLKRKEYVYGIVFIIAMLRCFFDWAAFPGMYEIIFYYIYFLLRKVPQKIVNKEGEKNVTALIK